LIRNFNKEFINFYMKKLNFRPSLLQILYLIIFSLLFVLVVFTPKLISSSLYLSENLIIEEEIVEGVLLGIMFFLGVVIVNLYKHEEARQKELLEKIKNDKKTTEEKLIDSFKYIGTLNVQIQEIKSIFNISDKYPETKNDFKKFFHFFSNRVFGIVNSEWVLFRIIDNNTLKTISEHFESRVGSTCTYPHISNKAIIDENSELSFTIIISNPQNLNILVGCVVPVEKISNEEQIFIQAIANEITMLYVILKSSFYKKVSKIPEREIHT
jgi:hypothetical protein